MSIFPIKEKILACANSGLLFLRCISNTGKDPGSGAVVSNRIRYWPTHKSQDIVLRTHFPYSIDTSLHFKSRAAVYKHILIQVIQ